jgi:hypothetical protein
MVHCRQHVETRMGAGMRSITSCVQCILGTMVLIINIIAVEITILLCISWRIGHDERDSKLAKLKAGILVVFIR